MLGPCFLPNTSVTTASAVSYVRSHLPFARFRPTDLTPKALGQLQQLPVLCAPCGISTKAGRQQPGKQYSSGCASGQLLSLRCCTTVLLFRNKDQQPDMVRHFKVDPAAHTLHVWKQVVCLTAGAFDERRASAGDAVIPCVACTRMNFQRAL